MSKIKAVNFANSVEANRKRLIQHCVDNGKTVSANASLDEVVAVNNTIESQGAVTGYKVEFRNIDNELFAPIQYVQVGGSATIPSETPTYDSDLLEFVEWYYGGDLTNVQDDTVCLPFYRTKFDENLNQRPTYIRCYFDSTTGLSPTIQIGSTHTNTYILWGDGSTAQQITSNTISHTYAEAGEYLITIYGDSYSLGGSSTGGIFTQSAYTYSASELYVGENWSGFPASYTFVGMYGLRHLILPNKSIVVYSSYSYPVYNLHSLQNLLVPKLFSGEYSGYWGMSLYRAKYVIDLSSLRGYNSSSSVYSQLYSCVYLYANLNNSSTAAGWFSSDYLLKSLDLSNVTYIGNNWCQSLYNLENLKLSNNLTTINTNFNNFYSLKTLIIPESVAVSKTALSNFYALESLTILAKTGDYSLLSTGLYSLKHLTITSGFDMDFRLVGDISKADLISFANNIKDNTDGTAKALTIYKSYMAKVNTIYLDENGQETTADAEGAVTWVEFVTNKNWTVSFIT